MAEQIRVLLTEQEVDERIEAVAEQINRDYGNTPLHLICILKGGAMFMCELAKRLKMPVSFDFMSVSSYGSGTVSTGAVKIVKDLDEPLDGKQVLIVEDIIDTGRTLNEILKILRVREPRSLRVITLLDKPDRRVVELNADLSLFTIPDYFVIGYGLDYGEFYRNLPYIAEFEE